MANDGQIVFEVTADGRHAIADIKDITRAIQQETKNWDAAAKTATDGMGNSFSGMLKKIAAGFSAVKIGQALLSIGKDAIQAASDLQEVQNVVDATFGTSGAAQIEAWAKAAGAQFGLTETQAKRFTSTLGAMMKSAGMSGSEIVGMSTDLAGLAADMASFYNMDFDTAFQKIRSGISGETEPLKQLGINMSVANLNAFALQQGLSKTFEQMSQSEQTMLRYQYLMHATADAQGDFARTSDGYANSIRTLETNLDTLKTKIGTAILPVINDLVAGINSLFSDGTERRTVLDDFADIDTATATRIEQIRTTAADARLLVDELETLGGANIGNAGTQVQKFANELASINFNQGKAGAVKDFITVLANNIQTVADIQGTDAEGAKEWLEGIAESAAKLSPDDAKGWETLINTIVTGLPGIENTDFGGSLIAALGGGVDGVESQTGALQWAIESLGNKTTKTAQEQALWLEICKTLVKTIPGLSEIINTETGEIKGGTQAVREYVQAWEDGQVKLAMLGALEQKESALASKYADLPTLRLDAATAERRVRKQREMMDALRAKYGLDGSGYGMIIRTTATGGQGILTDEEQEWNAAVAELGRLEKAAGDANAAYLEQVEAYEEAKAALEEYHDTIDELPGTIDDVVDATDEWLKSIGQTREGIGTLVDNAKDALTAMADYAKGVQDAALAAVESVAKGLERVDYKSYGKQIEEITELTRKQAQYKVGSDEWKALQAEIDKANKSLITTSSIYSNLESQEAFLDEYLANLQKARELGLSNELLAELSDGSVESAMYLDALVNGTDGRTAQEVDEKYQQIQAKRAALASELAGQQLTIDQTYQDLAAKAQEAVAALDLEGEAAQGSAATIAGVAQGIAEKIPEVADAVDGVIAELDRLNNYGINVDFGGFGGITFTTSTGKTEGSHRMGLDFVPHDDYIARLHEGERVLTAQENLIWNSLQNGGIAGFDLESLGGVMRDNVKAGGNVYLDGRVVGAVVSEQQGRSYRQLQRSGWQG